MGPEGRDEPTADAAREVPARHAESGQVRGRLLAFRLEALAEHFQGPRLVEGLAQLGELLLEAGYPLPLFRGGGEQALPLPQGIGERNFWHGASFLPVSGRLATTG